MDILDRQQVALRYKGFNDLYTFFNIIGKYVLSGRPYEPPLDFSWRASAFQEELLALVPAADGGGHEEDDWEVEGAEQQRAAVAWTVCQAAN